ncbi:MAG: MOMP family protein [Chlamydiia bacterium]|nr:MOMP family protein [Chlamydiia bacterium]
MKKFLALCVCMMGMAFAHPHDDQPILYYSDDCDIKILPNAGPRIRGDWNVFLTGDFIYWTVRQDGLLYAVSGAGAGVSGSVHGLDWNWDPGFKVGLGFNLPHDGWDLFAEYTWIHSDARDSTEQAAVTSNLIPYWVVSGSADFLTRASANWDVHYNNLTLDLGRNAYLSQYMKLRLFAGLHTAWIDQDYKAEYTTIANAIHRLDLDQDFWGIGLRAGLNNSFQFTKDFSFFADLALSILWGQFDLSRLERNTVNNVTTTALNTGVKPHTAEPVANIGAGFRYDVWFSQDRFHFLLQAGWEHSLWILHNEVIKNLSEPDHGGDFYLQGFTLKARFDF